MLTLLLTKMILPLVLAGRLNPNGALPKATNSACAPKGGSACASDTSGW
jgi:hypothetical protein